MALTKVSYSMIDGAPINVMDFGAVGDGVTDDTAAIQAAFNTVYTMTVFNYANLTTARKYAKKIVFPPGDYKTTGALTLGVSGKVMPWLTLDMSGASINSTYSGASAALTIYTPVDCNFIGLNVLSQSVTAINLQNSKCCSYTNIYAGAGTSALAAIHVEGCQFNNVWSNVNMNQNVGQAGSNYCWYWDTNTNVAPQLFAGGPINSFTGMHMANAEDGSMYWNGGSDIRLSVVENEGFPRAINEGVARFFNIERLSLDNVYQEAFPNPANSLYFESCSSVTLTNINSGSYYHYTKFNSCDRVFINNLTGGAIKYQNSNTNFVIENYRPLVAASRLIFQESSTGTFKNLQVRNTIVRDQTNTSTLAIIPSISTGTLEQSGNWILNPRALDASGNVTTLYCTCVNDPSYQDVSPLGFIESTVEIDAITNFPQLQLNFDTAKINNAKTSKAVVAVAWRKTPRTGFTAVNDSGVYAGVTPFSGANYGELLFTSGNWLISYTLVDVDSTNTRVDLVWNYNTIDPIGTKYTFGGALMYSGSDVAYPYLA